MFYELLAEEYFEIRTRMMKMPKNRQMNRALQGELFVLEYLMAHDREAHPKDLSRAMAVSTARVARLLKHMEEKMLIIRRMDGKDNRQVIVSLTDEGVALGEEQHEESRRAIIEMLEKLGSEDAREFIRILKKISDGFETPVEGSKKGGADF